MARMFLVYDLKHILLIRIPIWPPQPLRSIQYLVTDVGSDKPHRVIHYLVTDAGSDKPHRPRVIHYLVTRGGSRGGTPGVPPPP